MIYLSLGSNLGDRRAHLKQAKIELETAGFQISDKSFIYESIALLPPTSFNDWQQNYLNQVVCGKSNLTPEALLDLCKNIENKLGRTNKAKWAPRPMDIDILYFNDQIINDKNLKIPHTEISKRPFILSPLKDLNKNSNYINPLPLPKWTGIVNISPDSFSESDSKTNPIEKTKDLLENGCHIIDVGAESTRPGANPLSPTEEWDRLKAYLQEIILISHEFEARVSLDTYHPETAFKAIEMGVDYINDVSGLSEPMKEVCASTKTPWIFMHNLGLPASKNHILNLEEDTIEQIIAWFNTHLDFLESHGGKERFIFDPGIGFGKNAYQNRQILKRISELQELKYPLYIGHSRKSFLSGISNLPFFERDIETISISMDLSIKGIDYLRIHNMKDHRRAHLALQANYL